MAGFFAALYLGPVAGVIVGGVGHLLTEFTSGFPLTIPIHIVIALEMALFVYIFGLAYERLNEILLKLKEKEYIKEILSVGSKGILYELEEMGRTNNIGYILDDNLDLDIKRSGCPSTSAIISIEETKYEEFKSNIAIPVNRLGRFI